MKISKQTWHAFTRYLITADHGSIQIEVYNEELENGCKAFIWALWVDEEYRRQGIATRLIDKAEAICRDLGQEFVWLEWDERDTPREILDWYQRRGYNEVAFSETRSLLKKRLQQLSEKY